MKSVHTQIKPVQLSTQINTKRNWLNVQTKTWKHEISWTVRRVSFKTDYIVQGELLSFLSFLFPHSFCIVFWLGFGVVLLSVSTSTSPPNRKIWSISLSFSPDIITPFSASAGTTCIGASRSSRRIKYPMGKLVFFVYNTLPSTSLKVGGLVGLFLF